MPELTKDLVALLTYLLPGFLVAWLFYALTSHQKPSQFERVVQALIFTLLVNSLVVLEKHALLFVGRWLDLGAWSKDSELVAAVLTALAMGFFISWLANTDAFHSVLRKLKISQRSASPNEWCTVFAPREQFIVVQLKDDRRLYGWPTVWPSDPDKGHMFITFASWIHGIAPVELEEAEGVLIPVKDICHVEFAKPPEMNHGN